MTDHNERSCHEDLHCSPASTAGRAKTRRRLPRLAAVNASGPGSLIDKAVAVAASISRAARAGRHSIAGAESLTGGSVSCHLGAAEESSDWYLGGVTAHSSEVKFSVLGVDRGPVVTAACARQMAAGVAKLTSADFSVAVTGAGGPGPEEDKPAGTVFIAVHSASGTHVAEHHFTGEASQVVQQTTLEALHMLDGEIRTNPFGGS